MCNMRRGEGLFSTRKQMVGYSLNVMIHNSVRENIIAETEKCILVIWNKTG